MTPYTGIHDRNGTPIHEGYLLKVLIGKKNNGYRVIFECGAFCLAGGQLGGAMSFIKFRDELLEGKITGSPVLTPFNEFLEVISEQIGTGGTQ